MFSPGGRWRDSWISAWLAQAAAKPTLCVLSECLALLSGFDAILSIQPTLAPIHPLDTRTRLARGACTSAPDAALSRQSFAGRSQSFHNARTNERVFELSLSLRRETRLRTDRDLRKPARRKDVRALRIQGFESGGDHQIQGILPGIGLSQHGNQKFGNRRTAFRLLASARVGWRICPVPETVTDCFPPLAVRSF